MTKKKAFETLLESDREIVLLTHIGAILSWDEEVIPRKAGGERGRQAGYIASLAHEIASSDRMGELLSALGSDDAKSEGDGRDDFQKALIRIRYREWRQARNLSSSFVAAYSEAISRSYAIWREARLRKDFSLFESALKEVVALTKEKADAIKRDGQSRYDALLDLYEPGMTEKEYDSLFSTIKPVLVSLVRDAESVDDSFLKQKFDIAGQDRIAKTIMKEMGFDFSRGLKSVSLHPFTTTLGENDVRITTRYTDPSVMDSFYSTVHETGHALYEQWASFGKLKGTSLANGASYAMHESQSRLWENIIGRSRPFLSHCHSLFRREFPSLMEGITCERFYRAANKIESGFIRCNADEVSYSLHIMLRYEIEKKLFRDEIDVDDIPSLWDDLSREYLSLEIPDDSLGCLQDVHWSSGDIGYFPTYALGNLYGAQIWATLNEEMDTASLLACGNFLPITKWLGENIWRKGMLYEPKDLLFRVTGKRLDASYFTRYLEHKYREGE